MVQALAWLASSTEEFSQGQMPQVLSFCQEMEPFEPQVGMDVKIKQHSAVDNNNPWVAQKWTAAGNLTLLKQVVNTYEEKYEEENNSGK